MSIPFDIPEVVDFQDAGPASPLYQICHAMNQRDYALQVPRGEGQFFRQYAVSVATNPPTETWLLSGYPTFPINVTSSFRPRIQLRRFWHQLQVDAPNRWLGKFAEPPESPEDFVGLESIPSIDTMERAFQLAGIPGLRRITGQDSDGNWIIAGYGPVQDDDIIGPWLLRDLAKLYSVFTHRLIRPTHELVLDDHEKTPNHTWNKLGNSGVQETCEDAYAAAEAMFLSDTHGGGYHGLYLDRAFLRLVYEEDDPDPDSWRAQTVHASTRQRIDVLWAGQNAENRLHIESIYYYSKCRDAGAADGVAEFRGGSFPNAIEGRHVLSMQYESPITTTSLITPERNYFNGDSPSFGRLGVNCGSPTGGPPSNRDPTQPPQHPNIYVGIELFDTSVIYVMTYERNGL